MRRLDQLQTVLSAAEAVLAAREDQMLTSVEWEALEAALENARTTAPIDAVMPAVRIVFEGGLMMVMDGHNQGNDCHELSSPAAVAAMTGVMKVEAERQIDRWAASYKFDRADAKARLAEYLTEI
jgi:hypothetical protein